MGLADGVPSVPEYTSDEIREQLQQSRARAVDALLDAEDAERSARNLRRLANSRLKAYEHLLMEHAGQLTLEGTDDESLTRR